MPSSTRPHPVSIDRNKVLESAQKFLAKGQFDKAIVEYQKLTAADPKDVRTLLKIAELQAKKGSLRESVDTYLKVGDSYAGQGFFSKSIAVYKQAVRLDATRLDALKKLAQNYEELQHTADALTAYDMLAQAHQSQGQTDGALAAMRRATEIDQVSGVASWLQYQFAERWWVQGRIDYVGLQRTPLLPLERKQSLLLAFLPSEFSAFRVQYDRIPEGPRGKTDHTIALQFNVSIGAHPAHMY